MAKEKIFISVEEVKRYGIDCYYYYYQVMENYTPLYYIREKSKDGKVTSRSYALSLNAKRWESGLKEFLRKNNIS